MKENLREYDLVARFGGEEFAVVLEDISLEDVKNLFEKIRAAFENNTVTFNEQTISYTVSVGVVYDQITNIDKALAQADENLYEAKNSGRNRVVIS